MAPTTGRTANLVVAPGKKALPALLKDVKDGILVTSILGGNSNGTIGAFSHGFAGFRIANGERAEPISEMNLAGKHLELWKRLVAVGDDTYVWSSTRSPSLVFENVSVAGA
jgi:PmbA protein